MSQRTRS